MAYSKGLHSSSGGSHRGRPYALMLLLAFGAALLGVMVLHKLRERRIYNLLVKDKDRQILALQLLLQKERDRTKEMRRKNEEMKAKIYALRGQKMELDRRVVEMQSTMDSLKDEQKVMESAFEEKQNEIRIMQERGSNLGKGGSEVIALTENLEQKEAKIKDLKHRLEIPVKSHRVSINDPTIFPEIVTANGTMAAHDRTETENKEKDEHSRESAKYGGEFDDKRITNEDASESKLTKFKSGEVTVGVEDEIQVVIRNDERLNETDEHTQRQENWQVVGTGDSENGGEKITDGVLEKKSEDPQDDGGAGVIAKDTEAEVVDGRDNKTIREEHPGQLENNTDAGGQDFNVKQLAGNSGVKRKHDHVSRTKGKRRRTIVKNTLMGKNGMSESHGTVNMGSRKVYRDEKGELKDRIVGTGRVCDDENVVREEGGMDNNKSEDKPQAKLLKPQIHADREDAKNIIVSNTNHQLTNNRIDIHPEKQRLDEIRQSEEQDDSLVQQNWSRRRINKADKNARQAKSNMFHEEPEELEATDVQKQEKDGIDGGDNVEDNDDDLFKESQSDFEDEEEYKEEIDESELQPGL